MSTFVLIPGAWHGGWAWQPVARRLRRAGHRAVILTLPGLADGEDKASVQPDDAVNYIIDAVVRRDLYDVTLVAHCLGSYPATAASAKLADRLSKIIYVNAFVPIRDRAPFSEFYCDVQVAGRNLLYSSRDFSWSLSFDYVREMLHDQPEPLQRVVSDLLTAQPGNYVLEPYDVPDVTSLGIDLVYLLSEEDRSLPLLGSEYAARLGLHPIMIPGSHNSLLTHPDEVAEAMARTGHGRNHRLGDAGRMMPSPR